MGCRDAETGYMQDDTATFTAAFHVIKETCTFSRSLERIGSKARVVKSKSVSTGENFQGKFVWKIEHFTRLKRHSQEAQDHWPLCQEQALHCWRARLSPHCIPKGSVQQLPLSHAFIVLTDTSVFVCFFAVYGRCCMPTFSLCANCQAANRRRCILMVAWLSLSRLCRNTSRLDR